MRHFIFAETLAVAPLAGGMGMAPRQAGLIAFPGRSQRVAPRRPRTDRPAVALAAVTAATNQELTTTAGTVAQTRQGELHEDLRQLAEGSPGRHPSPRRILALQPCPARLGCGTGTDLAIGCRCRARSFDGSPFYPFRFLSSVIFRRL